MSVQTKTSITPEDYLERERAADYKSEYYNGEVFAMSGGSANHALIATNLTAALHAALKGGECRIYNSDLRVFIPAFNLYTYPDLSIACGDAQFLDEKQDTLTNPILLVEVLSPSTESYDRGQKFAFYRAIASLQEYVLVAQDRVSVEVFRKNEEGRWELYETDPEAGALDLASVDGTLKLDDLYANVTFIPTSRP